MLGAPLGGTTRGGHHGFESLALSFITPPNFIGGGGSCLPLIVTVASGEPGVPLICWADAGATANIKTQVINASQLQTADLIDCIGCLPAVLILRSRHEPVLYFGTIRT